MLVQRDDCYGVVALAGGRAVGSNFLWHMDEVAGVVKKDSNVHVQLLS